MRFAELVRSWEKDRHERGLFHDLMRLRVKEILLVGSLYDSFVVESDGFLTEQIYGEYSRLNLSAMPRVTSAYSPESAMAKFSSGVHDLVIIMAGLDFERPLALAGEMRRRSPSIPVLLLVLNNSSLAELDLGRPELSAFDRVFVWNGYSKLLVGMIKYVEDRANVDADIETGLVRVILVIEDSVRYYSRYLPLIYTVLLKQTQALIEEEKGVETYRLLRAKSRPKILLASTYEEAESLFARYEDHLLALITDLRFQRGGRMESEAGFSFVAMARQRRPNLPVLVQSSEEAVGEKARSLGVAFANKSSESLANELGGFIRTSLGFGPFVFTDAKGGAIAVATTIDQFLHLLMELPGDCLIRHAEKNHFSTWLSARGEYRFATLLRHYSTEDFATPEELRSFLLRVVGLVRLDKSEGLVPDFDEPLFRDPGSMTRLGSGSVGGKGRGIAFLGKLLAAEQLERDFPRVTLRLPRTLFIGIDVFEDFLERNGIWAEVYYRPEAGAFSRPFPPSDFPEAFVERLRRFLAVCAAPLVLRSSGLLEDLVCLPFGGVYESWFLPNRGRNPDERVGDFLEALLRVWAGLFSARARRHFDALGYSLEEERMGVVVQEVAGHAGEGGWRPLFSGIGFSDSAVGRGEGGQALPLAVLARGLGSRLSHGERPYALLRGAPEGFVVDRRAAGGGESCYLDLLRGPAPVEGRALPLTGPEGNEEESARGLEALVTEGAASALGRVLDLASRSFRNTVAIEFAFDRLPEGGRAELTLLQVRPLGQASLNEEGQVLRGEIGAEHYGPRRFGEAEDLLVLGGFGPGTDSADGLEAALRALNSRLSDLGRPYALVLPADSEESQRRACEGLAYSDISGASFVLQPATPPGPGYSPQGSHLFGNVVGGGGAWLVVAAELPLGGAELLEEGSSLSWIRLPRPLRFQAAGQGARVDCPLPGA